MRKDGGPAFPRTLPTGEFPPDECARIITAHEGMSKREYLAALALQGLLAAPPRTDRSRNQVRFFSPFDADDQHSFARAAVEHADALLTELRRNEEDTRT